MEHDLYADSYGILHRGKPTGFYAFCCEPNVGQRRD